MTRKLAQRTPRLFDRVATILEEARAAVVRTVNTRMVVAYWLIGREIVQAEQGGKKRAGYGDALLEDLSKRLTERYGKGYSVTNLKNFRTFHQVYASRLPSIRHSISDESGIRHEPRGELVTLSTDAAAPSKTGADGKSHTSCGESAVAADGLPVQSTLHFQSIRQTPSDESPPGMSSPKIRQTSSSELPVAWPTGFAPELSWSHYCLLMRVENQHARAFYVNYDRELCAPDDNPTVGLILCTDRNESMVRYTLPKGQKQIFAARYRTALPSEEELVKLLRRDWDMVVREQQAMYGEKAR
jgi:hypothetical protein